MTENQFIEEYWQVFITADETRTREYLNRGYTSWYFGDGEEMANELGALVVAGVKTATASLLWSYEADGESIPQVGDLSVVTDFHGNPMCIIETTEIRICPFNQVNAQFAYDEGEGDRSLEYWREGHWLFFSRECAAIECEPDEEMKVVCERFRKVYP